MTEKKKAGPGADLRKYRLFTLAELIPLLGLSKATLRCFIKNGKLEANIIAGKIRVSQAALDKFLAGPGKAVAEQGARAAREAKKKAMEQAKKAAVENYRKNAGEPGLSSVPQASGAGGPES